MKSELGKVSYYTKANGIVEVNFPEDRVVCQWCPYCRNEDSLKRWKCLLTGEYLVYPFISLGNECPLVIKEENDGNIQ